MDMSSSAVKKIVAPLLFLATLLSAVVFAEEAGLTNMIVTNTRDDLLLFLDVEGAFTEEMDQAVESGVPTTFTFYVTLHQVRGMWFDREIADIEVVHTLKRDTLKNEYTVSRSWDTGGPTVAESLERAKELMSEMKSLKVVALDRLRKGERYRIKSKAELSKVRLPLFLRYIIFFVSFWDFETDWHSIDFIY